MRNEKWIVVEDTTNEFWEGSLIGEKLHNQLEARGVVMLPVIPDLFRASGVGGFAKRAWGSGWPLDSPAPRFFCPLTIFCSKELRALYWTAKLVLEPSAREQIEKDPPKPLIGVIRVATDGSQYNPHRLGITEGTPPVEGSQLTAKALREDGAFIVGGRVNVHVPNDNHFGVALYGYMPGVRVAWAAISQAHPT